MELKKMSEERKYEFYDPTGKKYLPMVFSEFKKLSLEAKQSLSNSQATKDRYLYLKYKEALRLKKSLDELELIKYI